MASPPRIAPSDVRSQRENLLLVCAYNDDEKCRTYALNGSISLKDFQGRLDNLSKQQKIVFYCN